MLASVLVLAASFAALGTAQLASVANLPECAQPCADPLPAECSAIDVGCICRDTAWLEKIGCCIQTSCPQSDQEETIKAAGQLCSIANVQIPTALPTTCTSSATSSGSAKAASTGSTSKTGSSSNMMSSTTTGSDTVAAATGASSTGSAAATQTSNAAAKHLGYGSGAAGAVAVAFALL